MPACFFLFFFYNAFFSFPTLLQSVNKPKDWYRSMFRQIHKKPEGMCSPPISLSLWNNEKFLSIIFCHILHWSRRRIKPNSGLEILDLISEHCLTFQHMWSSMRKCTIDPLKVEPDRLCWAWWDSGYSLCRSFISEASELEDRDFKLIKCKKHKLLL